MDRTVYAGADWHERETWEMFGFTFDGHPDLRHIYLPGEFEGFPLRKDFPLLARVGEAVARASSTSSRCRASPTTRRGRGRGASRPS